MRDLAGLLLGVVFCALGLAAWLVHAALPRPRDRVLPGFASFVLLYGTRLLTASEPLRRATDAAVLVQLSAAITYFIPLTLLLGLEPLLGGPWPRRARRLAVLQVVFASTATAVDLVRGRPESGMLVNNVMVLTVLAPVIGALIAALRSPGGLGLGADGRIVGAGGIVFLLFALNENLESMRLLPWRTGAEPLGLLVLTLCLGYALARRVARGQRQLAALEQELATARRIQASILPRELPRLPGLAVAVRYLPMTAVAGDLYDFLDPGPRRLGVLVADVCGHGVGAALIASMVKIACAAQTERAARPAEVLAGINRILTANMQGSFATAAYLCLDLEARRLAYAGAGHPPILLCRAGSEPRGLLENGFPLGLFPDARYQALQEPLSAGDRIVLYTDGLIEAPSPTGDLFGEERLREAVAAGADLPAGAFADLVLARLAAWSVQSEGFADDVTLVVVDVA